MPGDYLVAAKGAVAGWEMVDTVAGLCGPEQSKFAVVAETEKGTEDLRNDKKIDEVHKKTEQYKKGES